MEGRVETRVASECLWAAMVDDDRRAGRRMRCALTAAVALHAVLFAVHWPSFAGGLTQREVVKPRIFVVVNHRIQPPEVRPVEVYAAPPRMVPIPDPTPHDPEPILERASVTEVEFDPGVVPWNDLEIPPPPKPAERGVIRVGVDVSPPAKVFAPDPVYPRAALLARVGGSVILQLRVDREGRVVDVEVLRPERLGLTEAAVEAVQRWRFEPSLADGEPVEVLYVLTVRFTPPR